jgi:hypothetical protein
MEEEVGSASGFYSDSWLLTSDFFPHSLVSLFSPLNAAAL